MFWLKYSLQKSKETWHTIHLRNKGISPNIAYLMEIAELSLMESIMQNMHEQTYMEKALHFTFSSLSSVL
ncbi:hypothetical protein EUGRSUZ_G02255 [Eucalyptus grandis]|uniref:Uncharacterized protein n=2 Tax=Eucalyptus grandis TaxID=71139 RepID=A0ACC3K5P5_EUCGR|nr:hypothetical protein EUGRSUZ_G02255 [Eucalyptus grandis]